MGIPWGALATGAAQARGSYLGGQQQGQQDALTRALLLAQQQRQAQQDALAQALGQANIFHLGAETNRLNQPLPRNIDPNSPQGIAAAIDKAKGIEAAKPSELSPHAFVLNGKPTMGFSDKKGQLYGSDAKPIPAGSRVEPFTPPPAPPSNVYLGSVDPTTGQTVYSVGKSKGPPDIQQTTTLKPQGAGGLSTGSQTSIADMEQRLAEIKQHATNLAQGKGAITRAMQTREGLEYGIANASAGGHGVPLLPTAQAAAMDALKIGGGPGNKDYDEYAALMNSQRALGDDAAKVFKGRQNEDAVKREIALASLQPGDYKNPQVVEQKLTRMQNIIDLAKVTQPRTGSMAAPTAGRGGSTAPDINDVDAYLKHLRSKKP